MFAERQTHFYAVPTPHVKFVVIASLVPRVFQSLESRRLDPLNTTSTNMATFSIFAKWTSKCRRKYLFEAQFGSSLINYKWNNLLLRNYLLPGVCFIRHFALKSFPWTQSTTGEVFHTIFEVLFPHSVYLLSLCYNSSVQTKQFLALFF